MKIFIFFMMLIYLVKPVMYANDEKTKQEVCGTFKVFRGGLGIESYRRGKRYILSIIFFDNSANF